MVRRRGARLQARLVTRHRLWQFLPDTSRQHSTNFQVVWKAKSRNPINVFTSKAGSRLLFHVKQAFTSFAVVSGVVVCLRFSFFLFLLFGRATYRRHIFATLQRKALGMPVSISVDEPATVRRLCWELEDDLLHADGLAKKRELMQELADAGMHDRLVKQVFFESGLFSHVVAEIQDTSRFNKVFVPPPASLSGSLRDHNRLVAIEQREEHQER